MSDKLGTDTVRLHASSAVSYGFLLTLAGSILGGVWFARGAVATMETLATTSKSDISALQAKFDAGDKELNARVDRVVQSFDKRLTDVERRDAERSSAVAAMDSRLARIEAQLDFMLRSFTRGEGMPPGAKK